MTPKKMIEALECHALEQMSEADGSRGGKLRVVWAEIGRNCGVSHRTVQNWKTGKPPGKQSLKLLKQYFNRMAARKGGEILRDIEDDDRKEDMNSVA